MKTSELTGTALNWAVASIEGYTHLRRNPHRFSDGRELIIAPPRAAYGPVLLAELAYSTDWSQGGPIIERELLDLHSSSGGDWTAEKWEYEVTSGGGTNTYIAFGPTPLIAAMRCYVSSKLGDDVEIPEELI